MSKLQPEKIFITPAPYTRDGSGRARIVYHPRRGPLTPEQLAPGGETVTVRPTERLHWRRLKNAGDVTFGKVPSKPRSSKKD